MDIRILIAEDEDRIREIVAEYLEDEGYEVIQAENGREALELFEKSRIDLAIIDIMMPEVDGWSVCRKLRNSSGVPIIIITARSDDDDKLMGFELGADDYVTKPFSPKVLTARVKNLLKRSSGAMDRESDSIKSGELVIDRQAYTAKLNGENLNLTTREYEILKQLVENQGKVLTRDYLLDTIWGDDYFGDSRIVDAHIKKIRKKLKEYSANLKTVLRVGYKFELER
jgi:DNA-binding response OmpR family regulator